MKKVTYFILFILGLSGCVEQFDIDTDNDAFEDILVVEASLTNEFKRHTVLLTRSIPLNINKIDDDDVANPIPTVTPIVYERNASVSIVDDTGNRFDFFETSPGTYVSTLNFSAQQDVSYTLEINTVAGKTYRSNPEKFTAVNPITAVYPEREFNAEGKDGVFIYVDGGNASSEPSYFRYTYDETFKIIAPNWKPQDFKLTNYDPCALPQITYNLEIVVRENEEGRVCYQTENSVDVIQTSTVQFDQNEFERFPVRFIDRNNYIISHRYSILVKQFTQSLEAHTYYKNLESFTSSSSIFSEIQPGFLESNIKNDSSDEKVLGYFEVASVSEKRMFFNYEDLFGQEPLPEYPVACRTFTLPIDHVSYCFMGPVANPCPQSIVEAVNSGQIAYDEVNPDTSEICSGPYIVTKRGCGDCTVFGKSEVPDFWIE